mmetsp:Transcript_3321/g.9611  ORF Transcript_3321/g.9611 Transcript_3321/m.9611 type:complete len:213 (+) Transcript_3321:1314-1952(+)
MTERRPPLRLEHGFSLLPFVALRNRSLNHFHCNWHPIPHGSVHSAEAALAQQRAQLHIFERLLVARNELGAPPAATCAADGAAAADAGAAQPAVAAATQHHIIQHTVQGGCRLHLDRREEVVGQLALPRHEAGDTDLRHVVQSLVGGWPELRCHTLQPVVCVSERQLQSKLLFGCHHDLGRLHGGLLPRVGLLEEGPQVRPHRLLPGRVHES